MKRPVAIACCLLILMQASLVAAEPGPLLKASLVKDPQKLFRADVATSSRPLADDDAQDSGNWMERHPVWAGTLIGFGAGFLITYAVGASERQQPDQLFKGIPPSGPALVFGGVAAGVGALAGWGIGRSRDKSPDRGASALTADRYSR